LQKFCNNIVEKNAIFSQKMAKTAENFDHNIDPRSAYSKRSLPKIVDPFQRSKRADGDRDCARGQQRPGKVGSWEKWFLCSESWVSAANFA
jgi:hypothetical protein